MSYQLTPKGRSVVKAMFAIAGILVVILTAVRFRDKVAPARPGTAVVASGAFGTTGSTTDAGHVTTPGTDRLGRPLRVAINTWPGHAPGLVANGDHLDSSQDTIFYRSNGILVEFRLIDDFNASRDAFRSGAVDVLWATVDSFAMEAPGMTALHPQAFLQFDYSAGGDAIAATANIRQVSDLRGKRVAYAQGTPSQFLLVYALTNAQMALSDVVSVPTATATEAATLFRSGRVDAAVSWDPDVTNAARDRSGGHILLSTKQADHIIADVFYARADFIAAHGDTLARFVGGWFDGVRAIKRDPSVGARALARGLTGVSLEDATAMLPNAHLSDYFENRRFFNLDRGENVTFETIFHNASGIWRTLGIQPNPIPAQGQFVIGPLQAVASSEAALNPNRPADRPQTYVAAATDGGVVTPVLTRRVSISFPTGSAALDGNASFALERVADLAASFGGARMRVTGNTDNTGNPAANRALSLRRAQAVADWLVTNANFDRTKFDVAGVGSDNPVAPNTTEEGRARNRRTDFEVIPGGVQ